ncbi:MULTISPECIES: hypothetical protein [Bacillaceae]|uniref:Uncharacterized protein n=1 Tax=Peribacillus huizhouensis TaxID=1501239 RepID=A0ABR6CWP1_9BACI|nr:MULTISPECIES: hypothetical protein [Bacillaceae]MBA9028752.1 hypothetical protein [Peribacillus huizhouensis]
MRLISPPELTDFIETSTTIQDVSRVRALDVYDGMAKLAIKKVCEPRAIGKIIKCVADFNNGMIDMDYV